MEVYIYGMIYSKFASCVCYIYRPRSDKMSDTSFQHIQETPPEVIVYQNVLKFCNFNGIELIDGHEDDEDAIYKKISIQSYTMVKGIKDDRPYYIFVFSKKSTTAGKNAFGSRADDIALIMRTVKEPVANIIFVSEHIPKTNVTKAISRHQLKDGVSYNVQNITHGVFMVDRLKNPIFKCRLLGSDESSEIKKQYEKNIMSFPVVSMSNADIIWLQGQPRQLVEYTYPSLMCGSTVYYRVIKR